ncbi:MAG: hypothetical protein LBH33_02700 [Endomicrobium sp.]|nr:hypothetical protein [Endomicrobium sp.]
MANRSAKKQISRSARPKLDRIPKRYKIAQARQQIIAVQREFQARQRTAIQMMEEVERLRENAGSLGYSVM